MVRSIVNFTNFFRQLIPDQSKLTAPLTDLIKDKTKKSTPISHTDASKEALLKLKRKLIQLPTLFIYDPNTVVYVFTLEQRRCFKIATQDCVGRVQTGPCWFGGAAPGGN